MRTETRELFNAYLDHQAELNGADADTVRREKAFSIEPSVQQKIADKQQESSAFLAQTNVVLVTEMKGQKLGLGDQGPIASRTNTTTTDRSPRETHEVEDLNGYECRKTDSDTAIRYATLDTWAKFSDFEARITAQRLRRQALDRLMIGFNGTSAAANTNRNANPLLQDVNIGWLEKYRQYRGGLYVMDNGRYGSTIRIGKGADCDYKNVHALIVDAANQLLPSWTQDEQGALAILGRGIEHEIFFPLINNDLPPTETNAADLILSARRVGGKQAAKVPYFPANAIFVNVPNNLSIYEQEGSRRRTVVDNAKRDRVETYESSNDDFVVEDYERGFLIENIEFVDDE